jgi:hypothetical protein
MLLVEPAAVAAAPRGSAEVSVIAVPPAESLAAWVVELSFDPTVVRAESEDCNPFDIPGGAIGVTQCTIVDTNGDDLSDTAKILGALIFSRTEGGLEEQTSLADITFTMAGQPAQCSPLRLRVVAFANPDGEETAPMLQDGQACVFGDAPPTGTAVPTEAVPRTSEPTPPPGQTLEPVPTVPGVTGAPPGDTGASSPATGGSPPVGTGSPSGTGVSTGSRTPAPPGATSAGGSDDDGGGGALIWILIGGVALAAVGGGAWLYARSRQRSSQEPPEKPTPTDG